MFTITDGEIKASLNKTKSTNFEAPLYGYSSFETLLDWPGFIRRFTELQESDDTRVYDLQEVMHNVYKLDRQILDMLILEKLDARYIGIRITNRKDMFKIEYQLRKKILDINNRYGFGRSRVANQDNDEGFTFKQHRISINPERIGVLKFHTHSEPKSKKDTNIKYRLYQRLILPSIYRGRIRNFTGQNVFHRLLYYARVHKSTDLSL